MDKLDQFYDKINKSTILFKFKNSSEKANKIFEVQLSIPGGVININKVILVDNIGICSHTKSVLFLIVVQVKNGILQLFCCSMRTREIVVGIAITGLLVARSLYGHNGLCKPIGSRPRNILGLDAVR